MYFDEDLLLDIRLNTLNNFVKKFVIAEATYTHNGTPKKLKFDINKFGKFKDKIDYVEKSNFLVNSLSDKSGNEFTYRMNFNNKKELQDFKRKLDGQKNIEKVNVIYN